MGNAQSVVGDYGAAPLAMRAAGYEPRYLPRALLRGFLHGLGPFFGNPLKPLVNYVEGNSYPRAFYQ